MAGGVEYQVTKVDPTDPETKGMVYQVHKVTEEVAATLGGKVYRARIIKDPTEPTVAGKVYQIVLIDDPDDPSVKGKVYNAILTGGSEAVVVGPGVSPLALDDAVAGNLDYVKAFGGTEQNGTPTPDTPVDIVSNNGALKARHQSGLPTGYTLLDYIESNGTQYIDLGYKGNGNTKVEVKFKYHTATSATGSGRVFGSRTTSLSNAFAIGTSSGVVSATGNKAFWCYDTQPFFVIDAPTFPIGDWQTVVFSATEHTLNGVSYGDDYNVVEFETPQNLKLFGFDNGGTMGCGQVDVAYCKLWDNGVLVRDLIPAKNNSNIIGMYDLVSGQFFTNQGTGDFVAGATVDDIEVYADGTVETINVHGKNLFDPTKVLFGYYRDRTTGNKTQNSYNFMSSDDGYIPCLPNTTYTFVGTNKTNGTYSKYNTIYFFDSAKNYLGASPSKLSQPTTGTTPSNCHYLQVRSNPLDNSTPIRDAFAQFNWQLEQGSTATAYEPYYDGGTATAKMLLKVGNYQDEQEILSGAVTRKVGVLVLDGTESWAKTSSTTRFMFYLSNAGDAITNNADTVCTIATGTRNNWDNASDLVVVRSNKNFGFMNPSNMTSSSTVSDWTTYLAAQYNAGTPVIVVYPLATPTTESVAGQTLQVTDGDNVLEITQASLSTLELEAEYQKSA